jgi:tRNA threonylcarbamoyladenosine biosynthesis protein TsaB
MSGPLILALESATARISCALLRGDTPVAETDAPPELPAAESLLPTVDRLLAQAGVREGDVEAYAVSVGPGSFTSLRIGIATAKGLAFGTGRPVAPVSTLAALARAAGRPAERVVALLDARRGELYAASWTHGGERADPAVPQGLYAPAALLERLPERCVLVGEGVALLEGLSLGPGVERVPPPRAEPHARHVGALGVRLLERGEAVQAAALLPDYGRAAEAEVRLRRRRPGTR